MEHNEEVNKILDVFRPGLERARAELDRIQKTKFYQQTQEVLDSFVYDSNHGVLGWWDADTRSWFEIWAYRQLKEGTMERWTYFPQTAEGEPAGLPSDVDPNLHPNLVAPLEAPYHVLKKLAMLTEQRSLTEA